MKLNSFLINVGLLLLSAHFNCLKAQNYSISYNCGNYLPIAGIERYNDKSLLTSCFYKNNYYLLLQFKEIPTEASMLKIKAAGIILDDYIPSNSYFAVVPVTVSINDLEDLGVRCIDKIKNEAKIDSLLKETEMPDYAVKVAGTVDVNVSYFGNISSLEAIELAKKTGAELLCNSEDFFELTLRINTTEIPKLASQPWVKWIEPIAPEMHSCNYFGNAIHRNNVLKSSQFGERNLTGKGVGVALFDYGTTYEHVDFRKRIKDRYGYYYYYYDHPTHCGGIICGNGNIDQNAEGMAPKADLFSYSYYFSYNFISLIDTNFQKYKFSIATFPFAFYYKKHGIYNSLSKKLDAEACKRKKLTQVWATDNNGPNYSTIATGYNSAKDNICVGALDRDTIAYFSSRGPTVDGRLKPDLCANGVNVYSTQYGSSYTFESGTSMATSAVAGMVALLVQRYKQLNNGMKPTSALVKAVLCNNAHDLGNAGPDFTYGYGSLNGLAAVQSLEAKTYLEDSINQNDTFLTYIKLPSNSVKLRAMLTWTDKAGSPSANKALVNDLDLILIKPDSNKVFPWALSPSSPSMSAFHGIDTLNVTEQITLENPDTGVYTLMIVGKKIPKGPQDFALTWRIDSSFLQITSPMGGESYSYRRRFLVYGLLSRDTNDISINWESEGTGKPFEIYFSADSGTNWLKFGTAPSFRRDAFFPVPDTFSTKCLIKIVSGSFTSITDSTFTIMGTPKFKTIETCPTMVLLSWKRRINAAAYEILRLDSASEEWKTISITQDSILADTNLTPNKEYWYSMRSITVDSARSPRSIAIAAYTVGTNCFYKDDAGIVSVDSPFNYCGNQKLNVQIKLENFGINLITSAQINWSVDGVLQTRYQYLDTLKHNEQATLTIGSFQCSNQDSIVIKIWTALPNGSADNGVYNDTLSKIIYKGMGGTYTIGKTGADFATFNDAVLALNKHGICSPVVFNVFDGIYQEQLMINYIIGVSATNTITFQSKSGDSSKVVLTYPTTYYYTNYPAVLTLDSAQRITLNKMTVERTYNYNYPNGKVIELQNEANFNTFSHCSLLGVKNPSVGYWAPIITSFYSICNNNTFSNNSIKYGGAQPIFFKGSYRSYNGIGYSNKFLSNIIDSLSESGDISFSTQDNLEFIGNTISNIGGTNLYPSTTFEGCSNVKVKNNKFLLGTATPIYGLRLYYCSGKNGNTSLVANNFISIAGSGTLQAGLDVEDCDSILIAYNNISINNNTKTSFGIYINSGFVNYDTTNIILDNCVSTYGGGQAIYADMRQIKEMNFNNYYLVNAANLGTYLDWFGSSVCKDLKAWKTGTGMDSNSLSINPNYISKNDLHIRNSNLVQKGKSIAGINTDIDGEKRDTLPTIGADEYEFQDAGFLSIDSPKNAFCEGMADIKVTVKNYRASDLTQLTLNCRIDSVLQNSMTWYGNIKGFGKDSGIISGNYYFTKGKHTVTIWTSNPNGAKDADLSNDSANTILIVKNTPKTEAGKNQSVCLGDSIQIGTPDTAGYVYQWTSNPIGFTSSLPNPLITPLVKTTYYLTVKDTTTGCQNSDSVIIAVKSKPSVNIIKDRSICIGTTIALGGNRIYGVLYKWTSNPSGFSDSTFYPYVTPIKNTTYYLTVTDTLNGCSNSDSVRINVNPLPKPNAGADQGICYGDTARIGTSADTNYRYLWSSYPLGFKDTNAVVKVHPAVSTIYYLTQTNKKSGCKAMDAVNVTINPKPFLGIIGSDSICSETIQNYYCPTMLKVYQWTIYGGIIISGDSTRSIYVKWIYPGTGQITLEGHICQGNSNSITRHITVFPNADAKWTATITNRTVSFSPNTLGQYYKWYFGNGDSLATATPYYTYSKDSLYKVKLKVTNTSGCADEYDSTITIKTVGVNGSFMTINYLNIAPNPFSKATYITYNIAHTGKVRMEIFDMTMKSVAILENRIQLTGNHIFILKPDELQMPAATYILKFSIDGLPICRKIVRM